MLDERGETIDKILVLEASDENLLYERMNRRRESDIAQGKTPRNDDQPQILKNRLDKFYQESQAVISAARQKGIEALSLSIDADMNPEMVQAEIRHLLDLNESPEPGKAPEIEGFAL
jgi:adenylate kinase